MIPDDPRLQLFGLIWRFSDAQKYTQLSAAEFRRFRPLSESESIGLWKRYVHPNASPGHRHLTELCVRRLVNWPEVASFTSESGDEELNVVANLERWSDAADSTEAIFFWHAEMAVRSEEGRGGKE